MSASTIDSELNAGTNVTLTTSSAGSGGNGDILVNNAISATTGTSGSTGSLTLSAYVSVHSGIRLRSRAEYCPGRRPAGERT